MERGLALIPLKWKLYAILAVAFVSGLLGIRAYIVADTEARLRAKLNAKRLEAIEDAQGVRNEIEALDRDTLKFRSRRWVRGTDR